MPTRFQSPDDIRKSLAKRYLNQRAAWLTSQGTWPLVLPLGAPSEEDAHRSPDLLRTWVSEWRNWQGTGLLQWQERRWRTLGTQHLPKSLSLSCAEEVAAWLDERQRWDLVLSRFTRLVQRWPLLPGRLSSHFDMLANYHDEDVERLIALLEWLECNPGSGLFPRQLPIAGLDSKWFESRQSMVADLYATLRGEERLGLNPLSYCGLRTNPPEIRMRLLDPEIRKQVGGLKDLLCPVPDLAQLTLPIQRVYIIENNQTGLAFHDLPGAVVFMGLGFSVDLLARLPWIGPCEVLYWGDLDTQGFAILSKARSYWPGMKSLLMDEETLLRHKDLWVEEPIQHAAMELPGLTQPEQGVYQGLKQQRWGMNVRLEQERLAWPEAWGTLLAGNNKHLDHALRGGGPP